MNLPRYSKQFNTRFGQFGFYWHMEDLGLGIALDWDYGSFNLHLGPFYFLYVSGDFSDNENDLKGEDTVASIYDQIQSIINFIINIDLDQEKDYLKQDLDEAVKDLEKVQQALF